MSESFGGLRDKVEKQLGTVQNTFSDSGGKTRTINRTLKDVGRLEAGDSPAILAFEEIASVAPLLAAETDEVE